MGLHEPQYCAGFGVSTLDVPAWSTCLPTSLPQRSRFLHGSSCLHPLSFYPARYPTCRLRWPTNRVSKLYCKGTSSQRSTSQHTNCHGRILLPSRRIQAFCKPPLQTKSKSQVNCVIGSDKSLVRKQSPAQHLRTKQPHI